MLPNRLDEMVNIGKLLFIGGLVNTPERGNRAVCSGSVYIQEWNIGLPEQTLPRWVLRGTTIRVGERSIRISEDGFRIVRNEKAQHEL